jgi:hypothetical protein
MDEDNKNKPTTEDIFSAELNKYLYSEYQYEDFFEETPEELMEKQEAFSNPICLDCSLETYSLLTEGENNVLSKCPGCKRSYKTHI